MDKRTLFIPSNVSLRNELWPGFAIKDGVISICAMGAMAIIMLVLSLIFTIDITVSVLTVAFTGVIFAGLLSRLTFDPANSNELGDALSRSIRSATGEALAERDVRKSKKLARQADDADALLDRIDAKNELIGQACIITMPFASSMEELEEACSTTKNLFSAQRLVIKPLGMLQREGFKCLTPYNLMPPIINQCYMRLMPLFSLMGGSPMAINSYQDANGIYFAKTASGNIVSLDMWYRGKDRTNSNFFVLGYPGIGKSTLVKHIIQIEIMKGTKILVIDPESEYREIVDYLGGQVFYAGGGDAKINMLQVRNAPDDDDDEQGEKLYKNVQQKGSVLAMHLKNVENIFRSYMIDAPEIEFAMLEKSLIELYRKFDITWFTDCSKMPADKFPVVSDLYEYVGAQMQDNDAMTELYGRLYSMAQGCDQFIFNGHTNVDLSNQIISFDTNSLQGQSDSIKRAQYMNLLSLCWEITSRDRDEKVMLLCDEGYLMVDAKLPQALMLLRNYSKRCRKVEGSLGFITHSVIDLMGDSIRQYGQPIMDNSTYKFLLGAEGRNLKELTDLYHLTEKQQDILMNSEQRRGLGIIGNTSMHLHFDLPQYKLDNMGKGGGR